MSGKLIRNICLLFALVCVVSCQMTTEAPVTTAAPVVATNAPTDTTNAPTDTTNAPTDTTTTAAMLPTTEAPTTTAAAGPVPVLTTTEAPTQQQTTEAPTATATTTAAVTTEAVASTTEVPVTTVVAPQATQPNATQANITAAPTGTTAAPNATVTNAPIVYSAILRAVLNITLDRFVDAQFQQLVANVINVRPELVRILSKQAGSVVVNFQVGGASQAAADNSARQFVALAPSNAPLNAQYPVQSVEVTPAGSAFSTAASVMIAAFIAVALLFVA